MNRLALNFARTRSRWPAKALLLLGALGSLHALWQRESLLTQIDTQTAQRMQLEQSLDQRNLTLAAAQENPAARTEARRLVTELQQPWEVMLDALQQATKTDVLITRLQPDIAAGQLVVDGQADNSDAFLAFVTRLRRQPEWLAVEPVSQERTTTPIPGGKPLGFQLRLMWRAP
jgi:hypothetical protein